MVRKNKTLKIAFFGILIGFINSLLGAGGGMIAVPLLNNLGLSDKSSHASAVAVILPLTIISAVIYLVKDYVNLSDAVWFLPTGVIGALIGSFLLKKISPVLLKKIFAVFMLYAGIRLLIR